MVNVVAAAKAKAAARRSISDGQQLHIYMSIRNNPSGTLTHTLTNFLPFSLFLLDFYHAFLFL